MTTYDLWPFPIRTAILLALAGGILNGCVDHSTETAGDFLASSGQDTQLFQEKNITKFSLHGTKKLVLTYDDGPTPAVTDRLLEVLRQYNIKATFFMLGRAVQSQSATVKKMRADGHILANHSYSHANLSKDLYNDVNRLLHEVDDADTKISPFMNPAHPKFFRAPYGAWTKTHAAKLNRRRDLRDYVGPVYWDMGGEMVPNHRPVHETEIKTAADWSCWTPDAKRGLTVPVRTCAAGYYAEISRMKGGVILMHDTDMRTVEMTAILIPKLLAEGYQFVNLDEVESLNTYQFNAAMGTK